MIRFRFVVVVVLTLIHPFIHGTPLDGGALDAGLLWALQGGVR